MHAPTSRLLAVMFLFFRSNFNWLSVTTLTVNVNRSYYLLSFS
jgi:hypothetical protein